MEVKILFLNITINNILDYIVKKICNSSSKDICGVTKKISEITG